MSVTLTPIFLAAAFTAAARFVCFVNALDALLGELDRW